MTQVSRRGAVVTLWGQVRPGSGRQEFRLRYRSGGKWRWLGGTRLTSSRGFWTLRARLPRGAVVQAWTEENLSGSVVLR